jgi:hypothetical protein
MFIEKENRRREKEYEFKLQMTIYPIKPGMSARFFLPIENSMWVKTIFITYLSIF